MHAGRLLSFLSAVARRKYPLTNFLSAAMHLRAAFSMFSKSPSFSQHAAALDWYAGTVGSMELASSYFSIAAAYCPDLKKAFPFALMASACALGMFGFFMEGGNENT